MKSQITSYLLVININIFLLLTCFHLKVIRSQFISDDNSVPDVDFMEKIESYLDSMVQPNYVVGYGYNSGPIYKQEGSGYDINYENNKITKVNDDREVNNVLGGLKEK